MVGKKTCEIMLFPDACSPAIRYARCRLWILSEVTKNIILRPNHAIHGRQRLQEHHLTSFQLSNSNKILNKKQGEFIPIFVLFLVLTLMFTKQKGEGISFALAIILDDQERTLLILTLKIRFKSPDQSQSSWVHSQ